MNVAELLLNIDNEYNGHKQTIINGLSVEQGIEICKALQEYTNDEYSFVIELWSDGSFSIIQKNYWEATEHPLGHKDRNILSNKE